MANPNQVQEKRTASSTATFNVATTARSCLVCVNSITSAVGTILTPTDTQGNTWLPVTAQISLTGVGSMRMYYVPNSIGGTNPTVTCNSGQIWLAELNNNNTAATFNAQNTNSGTSTSVTSGSITTTYAACMLIWASLTGSTSTAGDAAWTVKTDITVGIWQSRNVVATGTYSATGTQTSASPFVSVIAAFQGVVIQTGSSTIAATRTLTGTSISLRNAGSIISAGFSGIETARALRNANDAILIGSTVVPTSKAIHNAIDTIVRPITLTPTQRVLWNAVKTISAGITISPVYRNLRPITATITRSLTMLPTAAKTQGATCNIIRNVSMLATASNGVRSSAAIIRTAVLAVTGQISKRGATTIALTRGFSGTAQATHSAVDTITRPLTISALGGRRQSATCTISATRTVGATGLIGKRATCTIAATGTIAATLGNKLGAICHVSAFSFTVNNGASSKRATCTILAGTDTPWDAVGQVIDQNVYDTYALATSIGNLEVGTVIKNTVASIAAVATVVPTARGNRIAIATITRQVSTLFDSVKTSVGYAATLAPHVTVSPTARVLKNANTRLIIGHPLVPSSRIIAGITIAVAALATHFAKVTITRGITVAAASTTIHKAISAIAAKISIALNPVPFITTATLTPHITVGATAQSIHTATVRIFAGRPAPYQATLRIGSSLVAAASQRYRGTVTIAGRAIVTTQTNRILAAITIVAQAIRRASGQAMISRQATMSALPSLLTPLVSARCQIATRGFITSAAWNLLKASTYIQIGRVLGYIVNIGTKATVTANPSVRTGSATCYMYVGLNTIPRFMAPIRPRITVTPRAQIKYTIAAPIAAKITILATAQVSNFTANLTPHSSMVATSRLARTNSTAIVRQVTLVATAFLSTTGNPVGRLTPKVSILATMRTQARAILGLTPKITLLPSAKVTHPAICTITRSASIVAVNNNLTNSSLILLRTAITVVANAIYIAKGSSQIVTTSAMVARSIVTGNTHTTITRPVTITANPLVTGTSHATLSGRATVSVTAKATHTTPSVINAKATLVGRPRSVKQAVAVIVAHSLLRGDPFNSTSATTIRMRPGATVAATARAQHYGVNVIHNRSTVTANPHVTKNAGCTIANKATMINRSGITSSAQVIISASADMELGNDHHTLGRCGITYGFSVQAQSRNNSFGLLNVRAGAVLATTAMGSMSAALNLQARSQLRGRSLRAVNLVSTIAAHASITRALDTATFFGGNITSVGPQNPVGIVSTLTSVITKLS